MNNYQIMIIVAAKPEGLGGGGLLQVPRHGC